MDRKDNKWVFIFLGPAVLFLLTFKIFPMLYAFVMSLERYELKSLGFIGFKNYAAVLKDPSFWQSLGNTVWYVAISVPCTIAFSLFLAELLNNKIKGQDFFRVTYFLPYITSLVAVAAIWKIFYNPGDTGLFNYIIRSFGGTNAKWLEEPRGIFQLLLDPKGRVLRGFFGGPSLALFSIMLMTSWKIAGYQVVILLAGLKNIPAELYEAARIDGAPRIKQFFNITMPLLSPSLYFLVTTSIIFSFQLFGPIYIMTGYESGGAPAGTTLVTAYYMYKKAFRDMELGYAAAMAFVMFLIILVITVVQRKYSEKKVVYQ